MSANNYVLSIVAKEHELQRELLHQQQVISDKISHKIEELELSYQQLLQDGKSEIDRTVAYHKTANQVDLDRMRRDLEDNYLELVKKLENRLKDIIEVMLKQFW